LFDGYVLAFLFAFTAAAQAEPTSNLERHIREGTTSPSQGLETKFAQYAPMETGTHGDALNAAVHPSVDAICDAIASAATSNDLPLAFFTRLIWRESRFDPFLVSSKGARGIAQFMPATASWRGLKNPFDPIAAIPKAAQLLNELRREFGNIGLAAAAYNAGPERVRQWLARQQGLPRETQQYVRIVTGQRAEEWTVSTTATAPLETSPDIPCRLNDGRLVKAPPRPVEATGRLETSPNSQRSEEDELATAPPPTTQANAVAPAPRFAWAVQLIGKPSRALATLAWSQAEACGRSRGPSPRISRDQIIGRHLLVSRSYWDRRSRTSKSVMRTIGKRRRKLPGATQLTSKVMATFHLRPRFPYSATCVGGADPSSRQRPPRIACIKLTRRTKPQRCARPEPRRQSIGRSLR
jgi:hypothetical protein